MKILLVEDERDLAEGLRDNLELEGYEVTVAASGEEGLRRLESGAADLLVLDLMLPGISGFEVLRRLREAGHDLPVLILSARGSELEKVKGFRVGADDYVTKPFGLLELLARIQALMRRLRVQRPGVLRLGEVEIDPGARTVTRQGENLHLRPRELDLLLALVANLGDAMSRETLLADVWDYDPAVESRTVDWHVAELRRKIEPDPSTPRYLLTVRKFGYRLVD